MLSISPTTIAWLRAALKSDIEPARRLAKNAGFRCIHSQRSRTSAFSKSIHHQYAQTRAYSEAAAGRREEPFKRTAAVPKTHYDFFPKSISSGPPPQGPFAIDLKQLRNEFLQLQAQAHPDRHPPESKDKAQALSARINEAYKTLQNPLQRAQYLLSLRGIDVAEDETMKIEDPELLTEVLEAREQIEAAENEDEIQEMKEKNDQRIDESVAVIDEAFKSDDIDTAKSEAVKLRYWINIKESLDAWEKGKPVVLVH